MVTDRNTMPSLEFCFHAKLTAIGSEAKFISPINESLVFCWVVVNVFQPSGMVRGWVCMALLVGSLDNGVGPCSEEAEEESVIASPLGEILSSGSEANLLDLDVPSVFQLFEDSLEISFCRSFA
jgi:hypothetical protein